MNQNRKEIHLPPELEKFQKHLKSIVIGLLVIFLTFSSITTIDPEENGVVLRLGKFERTMTPGLNFKIPFLESVYKIPIERQLKLEFGYRTTRADVRSSYNSSGFDDESIMLTGDLNIGDVEWVVQYRINDAYRFLFKVRNPEKTLRDMSEAAMRQVVGNRTVDEVLTVGRQEIEVEVGQQLQLLCVEYENGIKIEQVVLQDVNPPDPVKPSFNGVNEAQQERERFINDARAEYNRVVPSARGKADETIKQAEGYAIERINKAYGETARFNELYKEYIKAPEITKKRIYLETMGDVLPKLGNKIIVDKNGQSVLPLLQMQLKESKGGSK